ncbi:AAA family ATPase [Bradyrhizobium sp. CB1650]|uniref:trifunctional serine/threonine-protein kinase/ATP-binding protein/sensor histidine kinase n=1 Tax=Bradyrhizobium sp. CB1650 TaxID=3039153 RepID=UPI0024358BCC|nr:AAA family ATPase [Bradyrhizobium sp. CB1650]WGD50329.1 AAA family ATPase [Bradyrhizobium sp. CB1650]
MNASTRHDSDGNRSFQVLWEDGDRVFCRRWSLGADGNRSTVLEVIPAAEHPSPAILDRLIREYELKSDLDGTWAARPLELIREGDRTTLLLEDSGGEPLDLRAATPMEVGRFLRLAMSTAVALGKLHERGLVHKDIKPANLLVNHDTGSVKLTGFGIASRLPRERQAPAPPEFIAGTLAYMAPEQTGRMNRSVDSRSDLYALGVSFYQMLTGALPFTASDPMEWVHCHIARQPAPPSKRLTDVPISLSNIIMKLLAKAAEDRYQTVAGLESDLRRCVRDWERQGRIDDFPLGQDDIPDRLLIPEKLYGRELEVKALLAAFERVAQSGAPELVLVSGYSGVGKSSVVNELHKALVPLSGMFASGKFDQYKRDIPYSTLVQALQRLVRPLLSKEEAELRDWRDAVQKAVGPNGQLICDLVAELKLIIGEQAPVPPLPPQDAQRRFQLVFRRLIGVFARPEHPLALFLDDLQWLDAATLDLLEDLLTQPDARHLMLIGAYRDNEVDSTHPLMRKLEAIRKTGVVVQEIVLAPLARQDLKQLIADSLRCEPVRAAPLAQLVHEKTGGNPFFAIQFISSLAEEEMLTFDHSTAGWFWNLDRIHAKGYTDNVVDLLVAKLARLSAETQNALQQLACLGNVAEIKTLSIVLATSEEEVHAALWPSLRQEFIERLPDAYRFVHDRIQEGAYSLIPEPLRPAAHLRIGRQLAAHVPPEEREEAIFEIVNQLNRGSRLITTVEERNRIAELNLIAGRRAKDSTAYGSALEYLTAGRALLTEESWNQKYELIFSLENLMAECELLTANMASAEDRLATLARRAIGSHDFALVTRLRLTLYTTLDQSDRGVKVCLEYLRSGGISWSPHPTKDEVIGEYKRIWSQLGCRQIEELIDLPLMTKSDVLDIMEVLAELVSPAHFSDEHLSSLVICRMVNLSLEFGNSESSCFAYVRFAIIAGPRFGSYNAAARFGRLGYNLVDQHGFKRFQARTYMSFGDLVLPWTKHVRAGRDLVRRAFDAANEMGDLTFAAFSRNHLITNLLAAGDPLAEVQAEAENGLRFARKIGFGFVVGKITAQLGLIRMLRGQNPKFGSFNNDEFDELRFEQYLANTPALAEVDCWYLIRKLQARFFAGDYASAVDAASRAKRLLWISPSQFETAEFHFYSALSLAAYLPLASSSEKQNYFEAVSDHHKQLEMWAENCPENFENRAALIGAEIARIETRDADAMRLYEDAIRSACSNGFVHNQALAYELAARFYAAREFEEIAHLYLRKARYYYLRWGAHGKVRQLEETYPHLQEEERAAIPTSTIAAPVEQLDLGTVIKVSQAVSGEIVLEKLLEIIMRTAIAQAGAERGVLILSTEAKPRVRAEATTSGGALVVHLRDQTVIATELPATVLHHVLRTRESVILDDATTEPPFAADPYVRERQARSILCIPLIAQAKLGGALYLENNLTTRVFAAARIAVVKLLASQAAIALENARLYRGLAEREAKIRRLVDANIIGIFISKRGGDIVEANDAFLQIVGYDREDLAAGRVRWTDLTPPQWLDSTAGALEELDTTGAAQAYEKEYLRKDGSRVPVLIGAAAFDQARDEGVTFVLDLTELKRAEAAAREMQMELAHANRVATMGQLSASIAHEISQPIGAAITYADAGLRWLGANPPNLEEARRAFGLVQESGVRAGEVMDRIRALAKKAPPQKGRLEINGVILDVIALTSREMEKNGISAQTHLAESLPAIQGDRVQLQQVLLNLLINAIEAMSGVNEGPRELLISTAKADIGVVVSVRDSGPGLMPESVERIFESFYTTKPGGLGMGLSICRSIIEAHGGRLWASANEPKGAAFHFTLAHCTRRASWD